MSHTLAQSFLLLLAIPTALACAYLLLATLLSAALPVPSRRSRRDLKFDLLVPAHNESAVIERTIRSLQSVDWPRGQMRLIVIADNCSDDTAALARRAGAEVWERRHETLRGKGHALAFAFGRSLTQGFADAVVVIDADTVVSPNLLEAVALRIEDGARAVQLHYGVLNPQASWRTRLMTIALTAMHVLRARARQRLRLSSGLRGNGMAFTHEVLRTCPYNACSLAEDLEYGIELGLAGIRIDYAEEAQVLGEMVSGEQASRSQRARWERGRFLMIRQKTLPLLGAALQRRSAVCLELACELMVLPLAHVVALAAALGLAALALSALQSGFAWAMTLAVATLSVIVLYVLRSWQLSATGARGLLDLARAPGFIAWKILLLCKPAHGQWVRTQRERP